MYVVVFQGTVFFVSQVRIGLDTNKTTMFRKKAVSVCYWYDFPYIFGAQ